MQITRISTTTELASLGESWNLLSSGIPTRSWQWIHTWWKHYSADGELYVLKMTAPGGEVVAIAPWYIRQNGNERTLAMLGSGEVCSDYLGILTTAEYESSIPGQLACWLVEAASKGDADRWDRFDLECVPAENVTLQRLVRRLSELGCGVHCRPDLGLWQMPLPATWEAFVARFPKTRRKRLRQYDRAITDHKLQLRLAQSADEVNQAMNALIDLHLRRRRMKNESSCFESEPYVGFLREAAVRMHSQGSAQLALLERDHLPVAVELSLLRNDAIYLYQSGFDPDAADLSPGHLITVLLIQRAIKERRAQFEFLRGDEGYKATWGAKPRETVSLRVAANRLGPQVRHRLWIAGHSFKDAVKTGITTSSGG